MQKISLKIPPKLNNLLIAEVKSKFKADMLIDWPTSSAIYYKIRKYSRYKVIYYNDTIEILVTDGNINSYVTIFDGFSLSYVKAYDDIYYGRVEYADRTFNSSTKYLDEIKEFLNSVPREA